MCYTHAAIASTVAMALCWAASQRIWMPRHGAPSTAESGSAGTVIMPGPQHGSPAATKSVVPLGYAFDDVFYGESDRYQQYTEKCMQSRRPRLSGRNGGPDVGSQLMHSCSLAAGQTACDR